MSGGRGGQGTAVDGEDAQLVAVPSASILKKVFPEKTDLDSEKNKSEFSSRNRGRPGLPEKAPFPAPFFPP